MLEIYNHFPAPSDNVLNIQEPQAYICHVWSYVRGHSVMMLRVLRKPTGELSYPNMYLFFEPVRYFEGPMSWMGANFCTGTLDEWGRLMHKLQSTEQLPEDAFPVSYDLPASSSGYLFKVDVPNFQVKIIANYVAVVDDVHSLPAQWRKLVEFDIRS